jgi:hypothetical protein
MAQAQDLDGNFTADSTQRRNGEADCNHNGFLDTVDVSRPHFGVGVEHLNGTWQFLNNTNDAQPIDFDNDGDMDLAALSSGPSNVGFVALWRNDGGPGLTWVADITDASWSYIWSVRVGDLNDDGRADLVVGDGGWPRVYVILATGAATFAPPVTLAASASNNGIMRIDIGDLDNDGDLDIVAPNVGMDIVDVWRNNGSGVFGSRASFPTGDSPTSVAIGDVTGDGLADIAVANRFLFAPTSTPDGTVSILRNTGTGFATHATLTMPTGTSAFGLMHPAPWDLVLVDHDLDGDIDLFGRGSTGYAFFNPGSGTPLSMSVMPFYDSNGRNHIIADVNNDGRLDQTIEPENSWDRYVFLNLPQWSADANMNGVPDECEGFLRCDTIDFNRDRNFPDTQDISDFIGVFAGAPCPTANCGDIDFNNDRQFPDTHDIQSFLGVFAGGPCE